MEAAGDKLNPITLPLSAVAGVLLALCISIGVRLETGAPPGLIPKAFAHLLGRPAPAFELDGTIGETVTLHSAGAAEAWMLVFTDTGCGACRAAYPSLRRAAEQLPVVVVGTGDRQELDTRLGQVAVAVGYDSLHTVNQLYQVTGLPSALLIDGRGVVQYAAIGSKSVDEVVAAWGGRRPGGR